MKLPNRRIVSFRGHQEGYPQNLSAFALSLSIFTPAPLETEYLDTPQGLVTLHGQRYAVRQEELERWAGSVFEVQPLGRILGETRELLAFPESMLLWLAPVVALLTGMPWAIPVLLAAYPLVTLLMAPVTAGALVSIARYANLVPAQAIYYIIFLSVVSQSGQIAVVIMSLAYFVLIRLDVLSRVFRIPIERLSSAFYHLRLPDVALRSRLLNIAAVYGVVLDSADDREMKIFSWKAW